MIVVVARRLVAVLEFQFAAGVVVQVVVGVPAELVQVGWPLVVLVVVAICLTNVLSLFPFCAFFGFGHSLRGMLVASEFVLRIRQVWHQWCY